MNFLAWPIVSLRFFCFPSPFEISGANKTAPQIALLIDGVRPTPIIPRFSRRTPSPGSARHVTRRRFSVVRWSMRRERPGAVLCAGLTIARFASTAICVASAQSLQRCVYVCTCVTHKKTFLLPIDIHHTQCACRFFILVSYQCRCNKSRIRTQERYCC